MKYFKLSTLLFIVLAASCNVKNTMPGPEAKIDESALKKMPLLLMITMLGKM